MRDLKNDIVDKKERVLGTEIYYCKNTIILNNPSKLKGKSCAEVMADFLSQFRNAKILPADLKTLIFWARLTSLIILGNFFILGKKNFIWRNKKVLTGFSNPANGKPYNTFERLPKASRDIFQ